MFLLVWQRPDTSRKIAINQEKRTMTHHLAATAAKRALRLSPLALLAAILLTLPLSYGDRYPLPSASFLYQSGYVYGNCATSTITRANASADQLDAEQRRALNNAPQEIEKTGSIVGDLVAVALLRDEIRRSYTERFREHDHTLLATLISCANAQIDASTFYSGPLQVDYYRVAIASSLSPLRIRWLAYPRRID